MSQVVGSILFCYFLCIFGIRGEMQELMDTLHNTCQGETGVMEDVIVKARKGDFAEDDKLKCYMKCLLEQMACIDEEGILDVEATIAILPDEIQDKVAKVITKCGTKVGANPCDNAFLINKCWYQEAPDDYFLV